MQSPPKSRLASRRDDWRRSARAGCRPRTSGSYSMDKISPERRSANMGRIRSKDTSPEVILRRLIHGLGYRFRLHRCDLPGKPDIVFPARRKIILMHGCFWHQHPGCPEGRIPGSRPEYWVAKLRRNQARDEGNRELLEQLGWKTFVVWECELRDTAAVTKTVRKFLSSSATASESRSR